MNIDVGAPEELVDLDQYPVLDPESSGFRRGGQQGAGPVVRPGFPVEPLTCSSTKPNSCERTIRS